MNGIPDLGGNFKDDAFLEPQVEVQIYGYSVYRELMQMNIVSSLFEEKQKCLAYAWQTCTAE